MRLSLFMVTAVTGTLLAAISASLAQTPTPAQQQAIRSSCVSDYRANCSSVPTGGMDALICLEQHEAKLSPACKSAVEAVDHGSGSPAASTSSAATASKSSTATTEGSSAATTATEATKSESGGGAETTASAPKAAAAPAAGRHTMSLRQEMRLAARSCARDFRVLCPNLPVGQGNVLFCLKVHANRLSSPCRNALIEAGKNSDIPLIRSSMIRRRVEIRAVSV